jgi:arylformamidase
MMDVDRDSVGVTGPLVWLGMDQAALDAAYDQGRYAPNRDQVLARYALNSERARSILGSPKRLGYGPSEAERLDIFCATQQRSGQSNAPISIFVHGGGWRGGNAATYAFLAEPFVRAGAHCLLLDFTNVDETAGDLAPLVEQVRRAIDWVYTHAASFGGDPERIYLVGHSSGGHLGGCVLTTDWSTRSLPPDLLKGALLVSGMYDLKPVRLSARSSYLAFTDEIEHTLSPARHLDAVTAPLILSYGTYETPEFQRQTAEFFALLQTAGKPSALLVAEGYNHFEILETLANPYGLLGRAALAQMGLGPA